jgi:hypothetical protein
MDSIYIDADLDDQTKRRCIYDGEIFVSSARPSVVALCEFARGLIEHAFGCADPRAAQHDLPADEFIAVLARLKPQFVHHHRSKELLQQLLSDFGCDLAKTYFDVPRLKSVTHSSEQASGLTYAIHPHRDTWYSAPFCQLNWWLPIYPIGTNSALAFHPRYWKEPVRNGSNRFNHYRWNKYARKSAADNFDDYLINQPRPEEPVELNPQLKPIPPVGGVILFSGAQLHSAVPNTWKVRSSLAWNWSGTMCSRGSAWPIAHLCLPATRTMRSRCPSHMSQATGGSAAARIPRRTLSSPQIPTRDACMHGCAEMRWNET